MPVLLFRLQGVPDEEANEVRDLLVQHDIGFYETSAGRWGISLAAIWLENDSQDPIAKQLIADYQQERQRTERAKHDELRRTGHVETFAARMRQEPLRFVFYLAIILLILYFSISPFLNMGS